MPLVDKKEYVLWLEEWYDLHTDAFIISKLYLQLLHQAEIHAKIDSLQISLA